jgi:hypothetical protein
MTSSTEKSTSNLQPNTPLKTPFIPSETDDKSDSDNNEAVTGPPSSSEDADQIQDQDSYDPHIIPAETAARREREGDNYKQLPRNSESSNSVDLAGGYSIDKEGLVNNYATEPEIYFEVPGDAKDANQIAIKADTYTIVDTFSSALEAEHIVAEMKREGLNTDRISIIGKDYQDTKHVNGSLNWPEINQAGGLSSVLTGLGISTSEALDYEAKIDAQQFLVIMIGSDHDISHANQILHSIGHRTREES